MRANHLLLLAIAAILYLQFPLVAGAFALGDRDGPRIYSGSYHSFLYLISYEAVHGEKPRINFNFERPLFYGLPRSPRNIDTDNKSPAQTPVREKQTCDFSEFSPFQAARGCGAHMIMAPKPAYPPEARAIGAEGSVEVRLLINAKTGLVEKACVIKGHEALASVAKEAGMKARFSPWGKSVQDKHSFVETSIVYNFVK
jgi:TonB-like protein